MTRSYVLALALLATIPAPPAGADPLYADTEVVQTAVDLAWDVIDSQTGQRGTLRCGMAAELSFSGVAGPSGTAAYNQATARIDCGGTRGGVTPSQVCARALLQYVYRPIGGPFVTQAQADRCGQGGPGGAQAVAGTAYHPCHPCGGYTYRAAGKFSISVPVQYTVSRPNGHCTPPDASNTLYCEVISGTVAYN